MNRQIVVLRACKRSNIEPEKVKSRLTYLTFRKDDSAIPEPSYSS